MTLPHYRWVTKEMQRLFRRQVDPEQWEERIDLTARQTRSAGPSPSRKQSTVSPSNGASNDPAHSSSPSHKTTERGIRPHCSSSRVASTDATVARIPTPVDPTVDQSQSEDLIARSANHASTRGRLEHESMAERGEVDTQRPSASRPVPHVVDRDWAVVGIGDVREVGQVVQYRAVWGDTRLPLPILRESQTGTLQVDVDGELCDIDSLDAVASDSADAVRLVRWQPKWMYTWELADARDLVVDFNLRHRRRPSKNRLGLSRYHSPEREVEGSPRFDLPDDLLLMPEDDADYTLSLMKVLHARLETGGDHARLPRSRIISYLNQFPRQRLKMRRRWLTREGETKEVLHACSADKLRAMIVYVLGQSRRRPFCTRSSWQQARTLTLRFTDAWEHEDELPTWEDLPGPPPPGLGETLTNDRALSTSTSHTPARQDHGVSRRSQEPALPTPPDSSLPSGPAGGEVGAAPNHPDHQEDIVDLMDNEIDHINTMTDQGFGTGASADVPDEVDDSSNTSDDDSDSEAASVQAAPSGLTPQSHRQHLVPNSNRSANKRKREDQDPSQASTPASTPPDADIEGRETNSSPPKRIRTLPYTHDCCAQGLPCEHPEYRTVHGKRKRQTKVFRHQRFSQDNLASDSEVRFVMRWSECAFAEQCHVAWEALHVRQLQEAKETGEVPFFGRKEHLIAYAFSDELNHIVATRCPIAPGSKAKPVLIDLCGDSD
ncbi:hypothetical protein AC579_7208 [Pseudocercospora musae]|uniref:Uncharacterized protein n=1 Tax=Pseudocercospora musae TaxID=113226 RepID=A0A139H962_9PEZI|nr:hypothetical protein AC579_7208 [Pseudocercospora musae]